MKLMLYETLAASTADFAIGIDLTAWLGPTCTAPQSAQGG